jgi:hypothetical protein
MFRGVPVAPGVISGFTVLVQHFEDYFLPDLPSGYRPALATRLGADNVRPLEGRTPAASAIHHDALGVPPIDLAEVLDFLDGVVPRHALDNTHLPSPFPAAYRGGTLLALTSDHCIPGFLGDM